MTTHSVEWTELSAEEIGSRYSEVELKRILAAEPFNLDSIRYFMGKANMIRYLREPDAHEEIREAAEVKRERHRQRNRENRPKGAVRDRVSAETEGRSFRFVRSERTEDGFTCAISERNARIAYVIEDTGDGAFFAVTKATATVLEELGRLSGLVLHKPESRSKKGKAARDAGEVTLADIAASVDTAAKKVAEAVVDEGFDYTDDDALEALLGSLD